MTVTPSRTAIVGIVGGMLALGVYLVCIAISWAMYPYAYSPLTNMISRLGNPNYNPVGAAFFNVGQILTGLCLVPFFFSFRAWRTDQKNQALLVKLTQIAGYISALGVILVGLNPEGVTWLHGYMGGFYFCANLSLFILSFFAFRKHPQFPRGFSTFCVIGICLNSINAVKLGLWILGEWLAIISSVGLTVLVLANALHIFRKNLAVSPKTEQ